MYAWAAPGIVETASSTANIQTLVTALKKGQLIQNLKDEGPFTIFAPTDQAFSKLGDKTLASLLQVSNQSNLRSVLTYHVVAGRLTSKDLIAKNRILTPNGQHLSTKIIDGSLQVNRTKIIKSDILCKNGVIHIIDEVLVPQMSNIAELLSKDDRFSTLLKLVKVSGLKDSLSQKNPLTVFAPTNKAFAKLPKATVVSLLKQENLPKLQAILKCHVSIGRHSVKDLLAKKKTQALNNESYPIKLAQGQVMVGNSRIIKNDIDASNGIIHVIDTILLPKPMKTKRPKNHYNRTQKPDLSSHFNKSEKVTKIIEHSIHHGCHLYNHGNPYACAALYEITLLSLMNLVELPKDLRNTVLSAMYQAKKTHNQRRKAWMYRHALNKIHNRFHQDMDTKEMTEMNMTF